MSSKIKYVLQQPSRLIYSSIVEPSAPEGTRAEPKYSATFGIGEVDLKELVRIMVEAMKAETGEFTAPDDYYLAAISSQKAIMRATEKAKLDMAGKPAEVASKIQTKIEARCKLYEPYAGILTSSSKFLPGLAKLEGGKIVDIDPSEHGLALAGKDLFYRGAYVVPQIELQAYRKKTIDAKSGVTGFLQRVLFIKNGEKLGNDKGSSVAAFSSFNGYSDVDPTADATDDSW